MNNGNDNSPATKADLKALGEDLKTLVERVETSLLTEFHKWASTYEIRARSVTQQTVALDERLGVLEERVSHLERRRTQN